MKKTILLMMVLAILIAAGAKCINTGKEGSGSSGTQPPARVTSPNPSDGEQDVFITRQLTWAPAAGATSYDVWFDVGNLPAIRIATTSDTTCNPGTLSPYYTYYWRIDSKNAGGTTVGQVWSFQTGSAAPPAPASSPNPADNLTDVPLSQQLSWASVSDATSYDVYFGTTSPGTLRDNQTGTTYNPGTLASSTRYYWRIDSRNAAGPTTGQVWSFQTALAQPSSPNPFNTQTSVVTTTQLSWTGVGGATSYDVYFGTSNPPAKVVTDTTNTSYNPGPLSYNTPYYWRIDSKNSTQTTTGIVWMFTTKIPPPAQATSPQPGDNASNVVITTKLSWASSEGATSYNVHFATTTPPTLVVVGSTAQEYNPGQLDFTTTYYWRIDPKNSTGTTTGTVWRFQTKDPTPPAQVTSPNPSSGSINAPLSQQLSWASALDAFSYDVYFGTTTSPSYQTNTTLTSYSSGILSYSVTYYWRIDSLNPAGPTTGTVWSFVTVPAPPPVVTSPMPPHLAIEVPLTQTLSWASALRATSYDVYFGTTSPGTFIGNQAVTSYTPSSLSYITTYYWRIDSKNTGGTTTGNIWSFQTQPPAPAKVTSPTPPSPAADVPITQVLSWAPVTYASSYNVYFGSTNPPSLVDNTAITSYNPGLLSYNATYHWRIDSRNLTATTTGDAWIFLTAPPPPPQVTSSNPISGATDVPLGRILTWTPASGATSYDVYLGTTTTPGYIANTATTSYNPGALTPTITYYWRIDSRNISGPTTGTLWSFQTVRSGGLDSLFGTGGVVTSNPTTTVDEPRAVVISSTYMYVAGFDAVSGNNRWRIEKRNQSNGALVTSPAFGTGGVVTTDPTTGSDIVNAVTCSSTYLYVVGFDSTGGGRWRIEKRNLSNGALVTSPVFGTGGVVTSDPSSLWDEAKAIAIDSTFMYVVGFDESPGAGNRQWRIEKRRLDNGNLDSTFGTSGVIVSNPSSGIDEPLSIAIDGNNMYVAGFDEIFGASNRQWRIEKRGLTTGAIVGTYTSNPTTGQDEARAIAIDASYMYVAGFDSTGGGQWRIEKRNLSNGALVTSPVFGTSGVVTSNPSGGADESRAIVIDGSFMYVAGYDASNTDWQWRIEKRNLSNGALVTTFGTNGVVTNNPSGGGDEARAIIADVTYLYVVGVDYFPGNLQWRIEKRVK
ncbi:MAG: hypothetical protein QME51_05660 [Planctomycetota bacterium]|nr:hypothetical protein [Planctomycetota bacterium]